VSVKITTGQTDPVIEKIIEALSRYQQDHPQAQIDIYRQNRVSVRLRIVDPSFAGLGKPHRSDLVWNYLEELPDEVQGDISAVILLTRDEAPASFANFEFDHPVPSKL